MPYKIIGNKIYHKKGGKWSVKQTAKNPANARAAVRLLQGIEHGSITKADVKNYRKKKPTKQG